MAEQEAEAVGASAMASEANRETSETRGESLLLPLLQGLLSGGGDRLLAGLGSAGADVVADVRRSLARLRAALAPPTAHPNAQALLALADRLEDALDAADRLDGVDSKRRPRRRPRSQRHTVGVTHEELEKARRAADRDQLDRLAEPRDLDSPPAPVPAPVSEPVPLPTPAPLESRIDNADASYHDAVRLRQKVPPLTYSVSYESAPIVNQDTNSVDRREGRRVDSYRHSIAEVEARPAPTRNGIAAIAHKFDMRSSPNDPKKAPLYQPLPPTYNFAAPPADDAPPPPRSLNARRARMKRANTIDIPKPFGTPHQDDDQEEGLSRATASLVPEFQPRTENDRKFLAFMQKNEGSQPGWNRAPAQMNWSNRFGNIKSSFESREARDTQTQLTPVSSAKRFWRTGDERALKTPVAPPTPPTPLTNVARFGRGNFSEQRRLHVDRENASTTAAPADTPSPKPFIAKPIPVNQFSHAPMSAFKPPKKLMSPRETPAPALSTAHAHVWSPPSIVSPRPSSVNNHSLSPVLPMSIADEKGKRVLNLIATKFENGDPFPRPPPSDDRDRKYTSQGIVNSWTVDVPRQTYPVRSIPSQNELAAPELVKKVYKTQNREPPTAFPPARDAQKLQIEFYEKQIREKGRRDPSPLTNGYHDSMTSGVKRAGPPHNSPIGYASAGYTPPNSTAAFMPLHQTPDIEKARAHQVDYLPDVVMSERRTGRAAPDGDPVEYRTVTRVMRGPVSQQATITSGVRTRHDQPQNAAQNLKGVLQKFSSPKHEVFSQIDRKKKQEPTRINRSQVPAPMSQAPDPVYRLPPAIKCEDASRSPRLVPSSDSIPSNDSSEYTGRGSARSTPSPGSGTRRVMARANSMNLLAVPKLFEGGIARDDVGQKKRTVEAYFSGKVTASGAGRARGGRAGAPFALGRSRTMPTVSELQFLDESNADDAFEDLVSALA